jgi:hypothetical protein
MVICQDGPCYVNVAELVVERNAYENMLFIKVEILGVFVFLCAV